LDIAPGNIYAFNDGSFISAGTFNKFLLGGDHLCIFHMSTTGFVWFKKINKEFNKVALKYYQPADIIYLAAYQDDDNF